MATNTIENTETNGKSHKPHKQEHEKEKDNCNNNLIKKAKSKLKDKVFEERQSLIFDLFEVKHIRTIHYIFMVFLLTLFINQIIDGIIHEGSISLHINTLYFNFSDGYLAILGWFILLAISLLAYPLFQIWAMTHHQMSKVPLVRKSWDALWLCGVLIFYYKIFAWAGNFVTDYNLSFTSSFAFVVETTRFLMKIHAFIRSNISKVLQQQNGFEMPSLFHYFEFLFVPTLVYRDTYPRTKSVNWLNVCIYALELCGVVIFLCYLYNMYFSAECEFFRTTPSYHLKEYVWLIFRNTIPSLAFMILMFYFILHLWQNLFAELTRFADRQFYQDWWNSTSYDEYYRKWNIIVHDWLYNYIYKDIFEIFTPKTPLVPKFLVFLVSALIHEYILYYTMRMFYPVLGTIFFTFAMIFTSFRSPKYWLLHVLFLYGYGLGFSITLTSYTTEYCVRLNPCTVNSTKIPFEWLYSKTFFSDCVN